MVSFGVLTPYVWCHMVSNGVELESLQATTLFCGILDFILIFENQNRFSIGQKKIYDVKNVLKSMPH